jgi:hypothetical protein
MTDDHELGVDELEEQTAEALPDREAMSLAGLGDSIVDLGFDHPMLPPDIDGYDPPPENAA